MNINENTKPEDLIKNMMSGEFSQFYESFPEGGSQGPRKWKAGLNQETMMNDAQQIFGKGDAGYDECPESYTRAITPKTGTKK